MLTSLKLRVMVPMRDRSRDSILLSLDTTLSVSVVVTLPGEETSTGGDSTSLSG